MARASKLAVIGFDSISLRTLEQFVRRGVMPHVEQLMRNGSVTQTWPCFPMETGTNWACLATGASPWVTGCNMSVHFPGTPLNQRSSGFPAEVCRAEQLWTTAHRAGKRSVVFDWSQSWPLAFEDGLIHVGEDGRPDNAIRALQEVRAYATHPRAEGPHVTRIELRSAVGWAAEHAGYIEFDVPIEPGPKSMYKTVEPLVALVTKSSAGFDQVSLFASRRERAPILTVRLGEWSGWVMHTFIADGEPVEAAVRAKLLKLSPDGREVHFYLSEIYPQDAFAHPTSLCEPLRHAAGPFVIQASRQQVVQGGASDIATYMDEQEHLARWHRDAAAWLLNEQDWDLFMLKWHGPDWTNHLTMYMIDPRHPMYEEARAEEGWALWDRLMGWGDDIVAAVMDAAGPDALVALVSDHGGDTMLPGIDGGHRDPNDILQANGWLARKPEGGVDWERTQAFGVEHYVYLNLKGRDPQGVVEPGEEFLSLREEIMDALLDAKDAAGRHRYRVVLPMETAGRLGVGGDRVGDIFLLPAARHPLAKVDPDEFWKTHSREETGTWDWPRLNAGAHSDDSYFVLAGPGVKAGYRRARATLITSVAPTLAAAWGVPAPRDADGAVLYDFLA